MTGVMPGSAFGRDFMIFHSPFFGEFYAEFHIGETMRTPSTPILRKEVLRVYGYS
jgi:hypothetical protein